ncbi:DJ-1/PfpI family protein [Spirosoma areae]
MKANILVYVSSATAVPYREGGSHGVGVFLGELTEPLEPLIEAGHRIQFVSPDGRGPHIDKSSFRLMYWGFSSKKLQRAQAFYETLKPLGIETPRKLSDILANASLLNSFDVLFVPGGHAPMTDILYKNWLTGPELNAETGQLLLHFHEAQKPTALICHAPAVLGAAPAIDGNWLYKGYKMTCVTMLSERLIEDMPGFKVMTGHIPDYPQRILERLGADMQQVNIPMVSNVVEDRELITGQDPYAGVELGKRLLPKIETYLAGKPTRATPLQGFV